MNSINPTDEQKNIRPTRPDQGVFSIRVKGRLQWDITDPTKIELPLPIDVRITSVRVQDATDQHFRLVLTFVAADLPFDHLYGLEEFRNSVVAALALSTMRGIEILERGCFHYMRSETEFILVMCGTSTIQNPTVLLRQPVVVILQTLTISERRAMHFLSRAMAAQNALDRFTNLAIAVELLLASGPKLPRKQPKQCPKCDFAITACPQCKATLKTPKADFAERIKFLLGADTLANQFRKCRDTAFHASEMESPEVFHQELLQLNEPVLLKVANFLRSKLHLPQVNERTFEMERESWLTIRYTPPGKGSG